ncbi:hypothetical protein [Nocardia terpenica]|uniref:Uncharacterized protein n=1 Tax=Nocardia terpenica TaxID=455432 RepID=A0A6G9ZE58_9NOCA|nr:hypothetical protein [Nocardia terpenica]QIS23691.1 hypothetical protein F6W96_40865 [Nocardia terpenica]
MISSTGSVLGRIVFAPKLGEHRISENMLLPRTAWTPVDKRAEARLETLKRRAGFTYSDE